MLLTLHVAIAMLSVVVSTRLLWRALRNQPNAFGGSYALIISTLTSGFLLAVRQPALLAHVCVSGATYLVVVTGLTVWAHHVSHRQLDAS